MHAIMNNININSNNKNRFDHCELNRINILENSGMQRYNVYFCVCFVDGASLYNLVNKTNLVYNSSCMVISISTCFGQLCAHHQEKLPY